MLIIEDSTTVVVEIAPGTKTTVPPVIEIGDVSDKVFVSAFVDVSVHVETPVPAFELEHVP